VILKINAKPTVKKNNNKKEMGKKRIAIENFKPTNSNKVVNTINANINSMTFTLTVTNGKIIKLIGTFLISISLLIRQFEEAINELANKLQAKNPEKKNMANSLYCIFMIRENTSAITVMLKMGFNIDQDKPNLLRLYFILSVLIVSVLINSKSLI